MVIDDAPSDSRALVPEICPTLLGVKIRLVELLADLGWNSMSGNSIDNNAARVFLPPGRYEIIALPPPPEKATTFGGFSALKMARLYIRVSIGLSSRSLFPFHQRYLQLEVELTILQACS